MHRAVAEKRPQIIIKLFGLFNFGCDNQVRQKRFFTDMGYRHRPGRTGQPGYINPFCAIGNMPVQPTDRLNRFDIFLCFRIRKGTQRTYSNLRQENAIMLRTAEPNSPTAFLCFTCKLQRKRKFVHRAAL